MTFKEIEKMHDIASKYSVKCPKCNHTMLVSNRFKRIPCSWCGTMVYASKKDEFKYKLKESMKNGKRKDMV